MVMGVVVFVNNARDITTSVSWRTGWTTVVIFIVKNLLSKDDIISLVNNVELYFG